MRSLIGIALLAASTTLGGYSSAQDHEKPDQIIANSSGGEEEVMRHAYYDDFEASTGIRVVSTSPAEFGRLRAMVESGNVEWTVTELESEDAYRAAAMGLLEKIDETIVDQSGFSLQEKNEYLFPRSIYSLVIGYADDAFPDGGPQNWTDFWDVERFPGPRAMRNHPTDNLEAALLADGVAPEDLYPLDVDRALRKLDEIYPHVAVWWTAGAQPVQMLIDGEVAVSTAWNSRLFNAITNGAPVSMAFGGGILKVASYAIPKGAKDARWGQELFKVMAKPENQAKYATVFGLSGPDPDHVNFVSDDVAELLPLAPHNAELQVWGDETWWLENGADIVERWNGWMLSK